MLTLVICPLNKLPERGFTLLELLLVLFIMSLISALVVPRLSNTLGTVDAAFARDEVFTQINALGYKALHQGRGFVLQQYPPPPAADSDTAAPPTAPLPLELPEGWALYSAKPIYFFANGACSGGELLISFQAAQYRVSLDPPFCQAH